LTMLPIPEHYKRDRVGEVWRVPYGELAAAAPAWANSHRIGAAAADQERVCLVAIDVQNTFCIPGFELYVGGISGQGAVEDTGRLCEFIYRNLGRITEIVPTMDTHQAMQIFHPVFWVDRDGHHPEPVATMITLADVESGRWRVNPAMGNLKALQNHALHYVGRLTALGKYPLTIWPYHSMLGGIGHALVSAFEQATFFHGIVRSTQAHIELKGDNPLTENYSVLRPEVLDGVEGAIATKNSALMEHLLAFDRVIIAGQAKSHCVAWTIADLLDEIEAVDPALAQKVVLLDDCASPVVVPGVVDFSDRAEEAYARFAAAGMKRVKSVDWAI
jgi:nicotinamidase-related amidase